MWPDLSLDAPPSFTPGSTKKGEDIEMGKNVPGHSAQKTYTTKPVIVEPLESNVPMSCRLNSPKFMFAIRSYCYLSRCG